MSRLKVIAVTFFACGIAVAFFAVIEYQMYLSAASPRPLPRHCLTCIAESSKTSSFGFVAASALGFSGIFTLKIDGKRGNNVITV